MLKEMASNLIIDKSMKIKNIKILQQLRSRQKQTVDFDQEALPSYHPTEKLSRRLFYTHRVSLSLSLSISLSLSLSLSLCLSLSVTVKARVTDRLKQLPGSVSGRRLQRAPVGLRL